MTALEESLTLVREQGKTVIIVTHDLEMAARTDRRIHLVDGMLAEAEPAT